MSSSFTMAFATNMTVLTKPTAFTTSFNPSVNFRTRQSKLTSNTPVALASPSSFRRLLVTTRTATTTTTANNFNTDNPSFQDENEPITSTTKHFQKVAIPTVSSVQPVPVPAHFVTGRRPLVSHARLALAFCARAVRRISSFRRQHPRTLKLARMGVSLTLAAVCMVVSRTALGPNLINTAPLATISTPTLPTWLPPRLVNIIKPFTEAFGVVFLSEFGDKSMFATALMAMKYSPLIVCIGALGALTVMTFIACFLGQLMHYLPAIVTHYSSIALFVFFGLQMIMQSRSLPSTPGGAGGERADAEEMVAGAVAQVQSPLSILARVSSLIFVAEWCDRSMLATMALAASSNTVAVIGGATMANIVCTGAAVCGAALVSSRISERMVALVAGILFEVFAVFTYLEGPEG